MGSDGRLLVRGQSHDTLETAFCEGDLETGKRVARQPGGQVE